VLSVCGAVFMSKFVRSTLSERTMLASQDT